MWLMPRALARWKRVTTVGLRRPRSRSLTYCCVKPETSAKCSWVKPLSLRSFPKLRPTSLRISMRANCGLHTMRFILYNMYLTDPVGGTDWNEAKVRRMHPLSRHGNRIIHHLLESV